MSSLWIVKNECSLPVLAGDDVAAQLEDLKSLPRFHLASMGGTRTTDKAALLSFCSPLSAKH